MYNLSILPTNSFFLLFTLLVFCQVLDDCGTRMLHNQLMHSLIHLLLALQLVCTKWINKFVYFFLFLQKNGKIYENISFYCPVNWQLKSSNPGNAIYIKALEQPTNVDHVVHCCQANLTFTVYIQIRLNDSKDSKKGHVYSFISNGLKIQMFMDFGY